MISFSLKSAEDGAQVCAGTSVPPAARWCGGGPPLSAHLPHSAARFNGRRCAFHEHRFGSHFSSFFTSHSARSAAFERIEPFFVVFFPLHFYSDGFH